MKTQRISNETIDVVVDYLSSQISKTDIKYDFVVGIGRGGLIPATMFAYRFHVPVLCYSIKTYEGREKSDDKRIIYQDVDFSKVNQGDDINILVVDDICDSGDTFSLIKNMDKGNVKIETFVSIFAKKSSGSIPDYVGLITEDNIWLKFPWEG